MKLEFKIGDALTAVFLAVLTYMILNNLGITSFPQKINRDYYQKAMKLEKKGEYKEAYRTYSKISKFYPAYPAVLIKKAECASKIGDEKGAIKNLNYLTLFYRLTPVYAQGEYNLGQVYYRGKKLNEAKNHFLQASKVDEKNKFSIASCYYLGQIYKKTDLAKAQFYWKKYIELCPDGRFSTECVHELRTSKAFLDSEDYSNIALTYLNASRYSEAKAFADKAPISKVWLTKARIYNKLGKSKEAESILLTGIRYYASKLDKNEARKAIDLYAGISDSSKKADLLKLSSLAGKNNDYVLFKLAKTLPLNQAQPLYSKILHNYPHSDFAPDSLFYIAWANYLSGNYSNTIKLTKKFLNEYDREKIAPKAVFWMAKAYEQQGKKHKANSIYKQILHKYPDSYFAFRANGRLKALQGGTDNGWATVSSNQIENENTSIDCPYSYKELVDKYGGLISELIVVGDVDMIPDFESLDAYTKSWIYLQQGNSSKSIVAARDKLLEESEKPDISSSIWRLAYPIYYSDLINLYAQNNSLDGYIVLSLMREESYFNNVANSVVNAQGLMQLMPATANEVARQKGLGYVSSRSLREPATNIKLGTSYLRTVKERFGGRTVLAVASYNGGPGAVSSWLKRSNTNDMDVFVESIPFPETKLYVEKVYRSYWNYKRIYENE